MRRTIRTTPSTRRMPTARSMTAAARRRSPRDGRGGRCRCRGHRRSDAPPPPDAASSRVAPPPRPACCRVAAGPRRAWQPRPPPSPCRARAAAPPRSAPPAATPHQTRRRTLQRGAACCRCARGRGRAPPPRRPRRWPGRRRGRPRDGRDHRGCGGGRRRLRHPAVRPRRRHRRPPAHRYPALTRSFRSRCGSRGGAASCPCARCARRCLPCPSTSTETTMTTTRRTSRRRRGDRRCRRPRVPQPRKPTASRRPWRHDAERST
mmetsp:Transcript_25660/g.89390  ORF Transcript_25660/g.89390 Transcript_25660/m.89390 type:complete len:263 (+) Transcript_25660:182-970(+)